MRALTSFVLLLFLASGSAVAADAPEPAPPVAAAPAVAAEAPKPNKAALDDQLFRAVTDGNAAEVKRLVNAGANPNTPSCTEKKRALNIAAAAGNKEIVEILIAAGADVNVKDGAGHSAIVCAALNDRQEIAKLIGAVRTGKITVEDLRKSNGVTIPLPPAAAVALAAPAPSPNPETNEYQELLKRMFEQVLIKGKAVADAEGASLPKVVNVSGSAYVVRQGGESDILRGLHVTLIRGTVPQAVLENALTMVARGEESASARWSDSSFERWAELYSYFRAKVAGPGDSAAALALIEKRGYLDVVRYVVDSTQIAATTTDVQGAYKFTNAPENAYIFAMFDTKDGFLLWAIPVKGEGSKDLFNDTALVSH